MLTKYVLFVFLVPLFAFSQPTLSQLQAEQNEDDLQLNHIPLVFEANHGQADSSVRFSTNRMRMQRRG